MFSEADRSHLVWLRTKAYQARERLELAQELNSEIEAELLLDLIDALGDGCVRTIISIVEKKHDLSVSSLEYRDLAEMSRDIVDVAWEVDDALDAITQYIGESDHR